MAPVLPTASVRPQTGETEYRWLGRDDRGVVLEVVAVQIAADVVLVLHVMPDYRGLEEE